MSELVMKLKAQEKLIKSNVFKWQNIDYFSIVEFPYMVVVVVDLGKALPLLSLRGGSKPVSVQDDLV